MFKYIQEGFQNTQKKVFMGILSILQRGFLYLLKTRILSVRFKNNAFRNDYECSDILQ